MPSFFASSKSGSGLRSRHLALVPARRARLRRRSPSAGRSWSAPARERRPARRRATSPRASSRSAAARSWRELSSLGDRAHLGRSEIDDAGHGANAPAEPMYGGEELAVAAAGAGGPTARNSCTGHRFRLRRSHCMSATRCLQHLRFHANFFAAERTTGSEGEVKQHDTNRQRSQSPRAARPVATC